MINLERVAFSHKGASAQARRLAADGWEIVNVWSNETRQGHATGLMKTITTWADKNQLVLFIHAQGQRHPTNMLTNKQLVWFYEKHGFVRQPEYIRSIRMIRHPSQEIRGL